MKSRILVVVMLLVLAIPLFGVRAQDSTIAEVLTADGRFTILLAAVEAAGLGDALAGEGPLTVFAPTDEAFAAVPESVIAYLLANPELLANILTYHVVEGAVASADVTTMMAPTLSGEELNIVVGEDGTVRVNSATVTEVDLAASNGVVHVIDGVLLPTIETPEVDPLSVTGDVLVAGSSTVYPVTERMADLFNQDGYSGTITVDLTGTGAGFERFCPNAETDISNASRPIRPDEVEACVANGRDPIGFLIGIDALAIVVSQENTFLEGVTLEQLMGIFSGEIANWNQLDPSFPAEPIQLFSPGTDSGTFDYFVEAVFDENEEPILNAPGIQFSEDDNVLVQGVLGSQYAIGYFGFAYYQENLDTLRAVPVEGVTPSEETGSSGEYPLSRPLFIYSAPSIMQEKPQVAAYINYYINNVDAQLGTEESQIGYIPVPSDTLNLNRLMWLAAVEGGM